MKHHFRHLVPFAVFCVLVALLAAGLRLNPRELPSPLIGRSAPAFDLPTLNGSPATLSPGHLRGQVWMLNVWASWCAACREEHSTMLELARLRVVPIYGLNYKDRRTDALAWLARLGDPYVASLADTAGLAGMDYGVYGVPETFVIDKAGVVRHRFTGALTPQLAREVIAPLVAELNS